MSLLRMKARLIAAASVVGGGLSAKDSTSTTEDGDHVLSKKRIASCKTRCLKMLERTRVAHGIPGYTASITYNGQTILSVGGGYADVENDVCCSNETVMRIASISKPLTSVALFQLWEKNKADLDAPIQQYVPKFPQKSFEGEPVTITTRHLLSHTAGVRHYKTKIDASDEGKMNNLKEMFSKKHYQSVDESLKLFCDDDLIAKPGTTFNYSTYGWTLVSGVIEVVSGMDYLQYMDHSVFRPLQMTSTGPEYNGPLLYNRSRQYWRSMKKGLQNTPYVDNSCKWAGGGFVSTSDDLVKFGNALLLSYNEWQRQEHLQDVNSSEKSKETSNSRTTDCVNTDEHQSTNRHTGRYILKPATVAMMWQPIVPVTKGVIKGAIGRICSAMGWFVEKEESSVNGGRQRLLTVSHTGGAIGCSSVLTIIPGTGEGSSRHQPDGVVVAVLINQQEFTGIYELGKRLAEEVYWSLGKEEKKERH